MEAPAQPCISMSACARVGTEHRLLAPENARSASLRIIVAHADHSASFLGFFGEELAIFSGRERKRRVAKGQGALGWTPLTCLNLERCVVQSARRNFLNQMLFTHVAK